jgi:hypothetical protein
MTNKTELLWILIDSHEEFINNELTECELTYEAEYRGGWLIKNVYFYYGVGACEPILRSESMTYIAAGK